jgi:hypothetical protein
VPVNPTRRLAVLTAMRWFPVGLVVPVLVLLLGARGLPLDQVGQAMALYGIVTLSLELPTGGLADAWGRRPVVVVAAALNAAGLLVLAFFGALPAILGGIAMLAAARALSSGPMESWFVDFMHELGDHHIEPGLAKGQIAESLALGLGSVIGGLLPVAFASLPHTGQGFLSLSVPFVLAACMQAVFAVAAVLLLTGETARERTSVASTVVAAARRSVKDAPVRRVMVVAMCLGVMLSGIELLAPNTFADLLGSPTAASGLYGVLTAVAFGTAALGAAVSARIPGRRPAVAAGAYITGAGIVLLVGVPLIGVAAAAFLLFYVVIGVQGPVMAGLLHDRVDSTVRSTMMSVESLALQGGGAFASLVVGALSAGVGLVAGLAVIAVAAVVAAGILWRDLGQSSRSRV